MELVWNVFVPLGIVMAMLSYAVSGTQWMHRKTGWPEKTCQALYLVVCLTFCLLGPFEVMAGVVLLVVVFGVSIWLFGLVGLFAPGVVLLLVMSTDMVFELGLAHAFLNAFVFPVVWMREAVFALFL